VFCIFSYNLHLLIYDLCHSSPLPRVFDSNLCCCADFFRARSDNHCLFAWMLGKTSFAPVDTHWPCYEVSENCLHCMVWNLLATRKVNLVSIVQTDVLEFRITVGARETVQTIQNSQTWAVNRFCFLPTQRSLKETSHRLKTSEDYSAAQNGHTVHSVSRCQMMSGSGSYYAIPMSCCKFVTTADIVRCTSGVVPLWLWEMPHKRGRSQSFTVHLLIV
jgi:hypothetical protein